MAHHFVVWHCTLSL